MRAWRAAIAVAALYALALQAVFGGASLALSPDPANVLCRQDAGSDDGPSKARLSHGHPDCCLVAHVLNSAAVPLSSVVPVVWPARRAVAPRWATRRRFSRGMAAGTRNPNETLMRLAALPTRPLTRLGTA